MFGAPQPRFRIYTKPSTYVRLISDLITARFYSSPTALTELETDLAQRVGSKHVILTPTARAGIYLSLFSLIKPGQKVILSPITIVDVVNMVLCAGGVPVFADVEPHTCNIDAAEVERLIDDQTGAVFITHLHGLACDVKRIKAICDARGVPLIEDSAQAFSTKVDGKWVGTFGKAGVFSFGMYKVVNAFYGGMVVTDDDALAARIREKMKTFPYMPLKVYGKKLLHGLMTDISTSPFPFSIFTYWLFRFGFLHDVSALNGMVSVDRFPVRRTAIPDSYLVRMSPAQARLIRTQLDQVENNNRRRIEASLLYHEGLSNLSGVVLPPRRTDGSHIYTYFAFRCPDRHDLMRYVLKHCRDMVVSHYHNCAGLDIFKEYYRDCPNAEATAKQLLYLPTYPRYKKSQVMRNVEVIKSYFKK